MGIEEERRWREYEAAVIAPPPPAAAAAAPSLAGPAEGAVADGAADGAAGAGAGAGGDEGHIEVAAPRNAQELREATEWLQNARTLCLKERNSESDMVFAVVPETQQHEGQVPGYRLQWSLPGTPAEVEGFCSLMDIAAVKPAPSDPTVFSLVLRGHNPQAVRNSGGLHAVNVRTGSASECAMYRSGLAALHAVANGSMSMN